MTRTNKPKQKVIKELASQFEAEIKNTLPLTVQRDGSIVYKTYVVKENKQGDWCLYDARSKLPIEFYYLKTCAVMAAKAYDSTNMLKFATIKQLDTQYRANYYESLIYTKNIKRAKDIDRYIILLNKLEESKSKVNSIKEEISKMFTWSFV